MLLDAKESLLKKKHAMKSLVSVTKCKPIDGKKSAKINIYIAIFHLKELIRHKLVILKHDAPYNNFKSKIFYLGYKQNILLHFAADFPSFKMSNKKTELIFFAMPGFDLAPA